jgi:hypothetical protein
MEIYKTKVFDRWAKKQDLNDKSFCDAIKEMENGLYEADLGGGLFKKRVARQGQGKRSGFRTLVATNKGDRWIFVYGFSKNERSNIDNDEEVALKKIANQLLSLTQIELEKLQSSKELLRINYNEKEKDEIGDT